MKKEIECLICGDMPLRSDANASKHCKMCGLPVYDDFKTLTENEKTLYFCCGRCQDYYQMIRKNLHKKVAIGQASLNDVKILSKEVVI